MDAYDKLKEAIGKYSDMGDDVKMFSHGGLMLTWERTRPIVSVGPLKLSTKKELEYAEEIAKEYEVGLDERDFGDSENPDYRSIFSKIFLDDGDESDRAIFKSAGMYYPDPKPQEEYDKCAEALSGAKIAYYDKLRELKRIV